jgi:hypothetical protein
MFAVLKGVCMFVFFNNLVMILVPFPVYIKVTIFACFFGGVFCSMWFGLFSFLFVCRMVIVM